MKSLPQVISRAVVLLIFTCVCAALGASLYLRSDIVGLNSKIGEDREVSDSRKVLYENKFIAHVLGGVSGHRYTNSRDAFIASYKKGFRLFEVDLYLIDDGSLICFHQGQEKNLGYEGPIAGISRADFLASRYHGTITPLDFPALLELLQEYNDAYLILDPKTEFSETMQVIVKEVQEVDPQLLDRIIPQIYREKQLAKLHLIYQFPTVIFTLYRIKHSEEKVATFVGENNIAAVAIPTKHFNKTFAKILLDLQVIPLVFTSSKPERIEKYFLNGARAVYTDFYIDRN